MRVTESAVLRSTSVTTARNSRTVSIGCDEFEVAVDAVRRGQGFEQCASGEDRGRFGLVSTAIAPPFGVRLYTD